jgi:hypothetical protein
MALCLFFELVEATDFFLVVVFAEVGLDAVLFDAGLWALAAGDGADWAAAGDKKPSHDRKKIPAKTATAIQRTQTLPSAESWHP